MGELSFLTIIVSLAVCSLLVYAVFQYMKVRLTILEQSHKEQALILQQFIEESSTDIHRLYQMKSSSSSSSHNNNDNDVHNGDGYHGSIILEYANANANREYEEKPIAYNEPHMIHLDTALFQNKRASNLIEISSDSEDTTESEASDDSASDDSASESSESGDESASESSDSSASDDDNSDIVEPEPAVIDELPAPVDPAPEIKMITVDLGTIQEITSSISDNAAADVNPSSSSPPIDVLAMLHKKAQQPNTDDDEIVFTLPEMPAPATAAPTNQSISGLSVTELRFLLKEKYKQQPEKHPEIQKMKKAELIQALQ